MSRTADGWHTTAPRITLTGTDETGGSGVEQIQYRINGGAPQFYAGPFNLTDRGRPEVRVPRDRPRRQPRSRSRASRSRSTPRRRRRPSFTYPTDSPASGWNDHEVEVTLRATDGAGSGTAKTEYRVNAADDDAAWTEYDDTFDVGGSGTQRRRVPHPRQGRQRRADQVDRTCTST